MPVATGLPQICTKSLLQSLRCHPGLPRHAWYLVAGVTLSGLNRPDELGTVLTHALERGPGGGEPSATRSTAACEPTAASPLSAPAQLEIARKLREALVRTVATQGLPKAINALLALKRATPAELLDAPPPSPAAPAVTGRRADVYEAPSVQVLARGQRFFDRTYGKVAARVMGAMDACGTEDLGLAARLAYGHLLSCPAVLEPRECSFVLLAGLIPQDVNPQLKGHLKGALNNGATVEEVRAVREAAIRICKAAGMVLLGPHERSGWGWRAPVANL